MEIDVDVDVDVHVEVRPLLELVGHGADASELLLDGVAPVDVNQVEDGTGFCGGGLRIAEVLHAIPPGHPGASPP